MDPLGLAVKQEPQHAGEPPFSEEASDSPNSAELSPGGPTHPAGNDLMRESPKDPSGQLLGGRKYSDHCEERASRPGKSRIPGRDHRRYYHEHWRAEYLMDFNAARHGMICMVCGSSLATLKLSTIKRHIRQKHPYSLAWSAHEKEVITNSWDAHLGLEMETDGARDPAETSDSQQEAQEELAPGAGRRRRRGPGSLSSRGGRRSSTLGWKSTSDGETRNLERYLKESLHSWFQSEFLMDYDLQGNRLFCMMCGSSLPSLNLDDIKHHVMEAHPSSLGFSPAEKAAILEAWNTRSQTAEGKSPRETPVATGEAELDSAAQDLSMREAEASPDRPAGKEGSEDGVAWDVGESSPPAQPRGRDHRRYFQEHWRVEYLMDYNGLRHGLVCMVCGSALATLKMSTIKRHIQQKHPDSTQLSHQVKALIVQEWNRKAARLGDAEESPPETDAGTNEVESQRVLNPTLSPEDSREDRTILGGDAANAREGVNPAPSQPSAEAASPAASSPSGRGQRRNYQPRWRTEYLMDYDEKRRGLICMVCGGTLATLNVSTIKRHILQVHSFSLEYTAVEKKTILEAYTENHQALHPGPKASKAHSRLNSDSCDIKPNIPKAGKMGFSYKLPVCTA